MSGLDFTLDPKTGDLIVGDDGWFEMAETSQAAVVYQLDHERDAWDGDPDAGSLLKKALELGGSDAQQFAVVETTRALGALAADDVISDVQVKLGPNPAPGVPPGPLVVLTSYRDNAADDRISGVVNPFGGG